VALIAIFLTAFLLAVGLVQLLSRVIEARTPDDGWGRRGG